MKRRLVRFGAISASIAALSFSFVFDVAQAQDAVPATPVSCKVVLENGRVRVVDVQFGRSAGKSHSQVGYASRFVRQDVLKNDDVSVADVQFGQSAAKSHSQVGYASRFVRQDGLKNDDVSVADVQFGQSADESRGQVGYASRFVRQEPSHITSLGTSVANALLIELKETAK